MSWFEMKWVNTLRLIKEKRVVEKKIVIFDICGTLMNIRHRLKYIQGKKKDWNSFHLACIDDAPIDNIISLYNSVSNDNPIMLLTSRPESSRNLTIQSLSKHILFYDKYKHKIYMRKDGDYRQDYIVKAEILKSLNITPEKVLCIFEDRTQNVDYLRELGYTVIQVANGDY